MKRSGSLYILVAAVIAIGAVIFLAVGGLGDNLVYYWSPTELSQHYATAAGRGEEADQRAVVRLGGEVKPGTLVPGDGASDLSFVVTDGAVDVKVHSTAVPPQMFREGIGVVVEGVMGPDGVFSSERIMVKHSNQYEAPKDGEKPDYVAPTAGNM